MSVTASSVYEQTESLKHIDQIFEMAVQNELDLAKAIQQIVMHASSLSISESFRLVAILSKNLNNNASIMSKLVALIVMKELFLTSLHQFYIFGSIRYLPWISSMTKFEQRKTQHERTRAYMKQLSVRGNGDQIIQERHCHKLLKLVQQFLPWFASHMPTHINAQFEFRSTFARIYQEIPSKKPITRYEYFADEDYNKLVTNFGANRNLNAGYIQELGEFVLLEVRTLIDAGKGRSEMLGLIVQTSDSYCIRAIVSEICNFCEDSSKIVTCLKLTDYLMGFGEIQFAQLTKLQIVPALLDHISPNDHAPQPYKAPQNSLSGSVSESRLIADYICVWAEANRQLGLLTEFYDEVLKWLSQRSIALTEVRESRLGQFLTNEIDMKGVNSDKIKHILNYALEKQVIAALNSRRSPQRDSGRLNNSAIDGLDDFKESQISNFQPRYGDFEPIQQALTIQNYQFRGAQTNKSRPSNNLIGQPQLDPPVMTFKNTLQIQEGIEMKQASYQGSIRLENNNKSRSSFVQFDPSSLSKYSEYSVKRSKSPQSDHKDFNPIGVSRIGSQRSMPSSSVVYFDRSETEKLASPSRMTPLNSKNRADHSSVQLNQGQINSMKSLKSQRDNYSFKSSHVSNTYSSQSQVKGFGKEDNYFPASSPKQTFGFKKKPSGSLRQMQNQPYGNVLEDDLNKNQLESYEQGNNLKLGKKMPSQASIMSSQIQDKSGGRHILEVSASMGSVDSILGIRKPLKLGASVNKKPKVKVPVKGPDEVQKLKFNPYLQYYVNDAELQQNRTRLKRSRYQPKVSSLSARRSNKHSSEKSLEIRQQGGYATSHKNSQQTERKKHLIINEFENDKILQLQKELGKALQQKNAKEAALADKQKQCRLLKSKSMPYVGKKIQSLKKQNEIINILTNQKNKEEYGLRSEAIVRPVKQHIQMEDYFFCNEPKTTLSSLPEPYDRALTKQILGQRCLLLVNEDLELGYHYSQRLHQISLYLTFYKVFDESHICIAENSLKLQQELVLKLENQSAGTQLKIKRKIKGIQLRGDTKFSSIIQGTNHKKYHFPELTVAIHDQGCSKQVTIKIPCCLFNLATPVQISSQTIEQLRPKKVTRTQVVPLNHELARNTKEKLEKYFPARVALSEGWHILGFRVDQYFRPAAAEFFKFRILSGKRVELEFFDDPDSLLAEAVVGLLTGPPAGNT